VKGDVSVENGQFPAYSISGSPTLHQLCVVYRVCERSFWKIFGFIPRNCFNFGAGFGFSIFTLRDLFYTVYLLNFIINNSHN